MIKRFIIAIVLLVLVCGGIVGFNMFRDNAIQQFFANMPVASVTVATAKVEPAAWTPGIETIGTVAASQGVDLTVETTGIVKEIKFKANQRVNKGDVLIQLDDSVQQADLAAAKTQAALDKQLLDRAVALQERGVGSDVVRDSAGAKASTSASQVEKLQAVLDQKQLRAPFSGTIGIPKVDAGQYLQPGTIVATLQDLETMRADFAVPEHQLSLLKLGQPVQFGVTEGDMPFTGSVIGIDPKVDPQSRLVSVRAEITNPQGKLSPGQFVRVRVVLPEEDGVVAVPLTALTSSLYGDFVYVVRPAADKAEASAAAAEPAKEQAEPALVVKQIFVKVGRRSEGRVEILEGVSFGDEIVIAGQNRLSNGTPVKVDNTVSPVVSTDAKASAK
ncbi:efflux RND transporter periplasmic adaptor subunit [Aminobacter sp. AP02]|uniref:efflux RND transporter periplasmic adaptor subunit n=1 Tax=Aminobacter sp. AP02 TaxID=2135737 RepID=UPI000D6CC614|nr:efflux RND transporter periplasmic adaptor subunit [Aminobacter sp. AP02]PWK68131.1 membrane fusion protein (multidrug efflux system) [Aminobacter sp. AP02]